MQNIPQLYLERDLASWFTMHLRFSSLSTLPALPRSQQDKSDVDLSSWGLLRILKPWYSSRRFVVPFGRNGPRQCDTINNVQPTLEEARRKVWLSGVKLSISRSLQFFSTFNPPIRSPHMPILQLNGQHGQRCIPYGSVALTPWAVSWNAPIEGLHLHMWPITYIGTVLIVVLCYLLWMNNSLYRVIWHAFASDRGHQARIIPLRYEAPVTIYVDALSFTGHIFCFSR